MISQDYLAGFIDGEGCISILKKKHRKKRSDGERIYIEYAANVNIANTNKEILEKIREQYGGVLYSLNTKAPKPHWKPRYQLIITHLAAYRLCKALKYKLEVKGPNAEIILKLQATKSKAWRTEADLTYQESLYQEIKKLNHKIL